HYVVAVSHDGYGWLVYVACMAPVLLLARWLEFREPLPENEDYHARSSFRLASARAFFFAGVLVSGIVAGPAIIRQTPEMPPSPTRSLLPVELGRWEKGIPVVNWQPEFLAPYHKERQAYVLGDSTQV